MLAQELMRQDADLPYIPHRGRKTAPGTAQCNDLYQCSGSIRVLRTLYRSRGNTERLRDMSATWYGHSS